MSNFLSDIRFLVRTLRRQPGFTIVAVLTFAIGIGANTAVFSVLNGVILEPLPYEEPSELVRLYSASTQSPDDRQYLSGLDILDVRDEIDAFSSVGIMYTYRDVGRDLLIDGSAQRIRVLPISADYFATFGATPLVGRTFSRDEERADASQVILSHGLWIVLTGSDKAVIGRAIELDGESLQVIGVMRPNFSDVSVGEIAAWVPENLDREASRNNRGNNYLSAVARLAPGVTVRQAQAQMDALMDRIRQEVPDRTRTLRVLPLYDDIVGESSTAVYVLMGAAGLVLLITCLNVANLFLARSAAQTRETAIRTALGAARLRIIGQRFTESVLVATAGGVVGSLVAYWGVKLLLAISPDSLARAEQVGYDTRLLGFALAITVITGIVFGAAPAYQSSRIDPNEALHDGARGNTSGRGIRQARNVLVASQVSLALVLLVGAGILGRSFLAMQQVDLGFGSENIATFEVHLPEARYADPEQRVLFHHTFHERLAGLPGVSHVAATSWLPGNGAYHHWGVGFLDDAGERQWTGAMIRVVEGDYLDALGIQLLKGRMFTRGDRVGTDGVVVVNRKLATRVFGEGDPIGEELRVGGDIRRIVGMVSDVAFGADGTGMENAYLSHSQFAGDRNWGLIYVVKVKADPRTIIEPARRELAGIDNALVLFEPRTMDAVLGRHRARDQFTLLLMVVFAGVALTLAAVGIYGVLSYTVSQRTHEIGVRMALGAQATQVRRIVMRHGMIVAGIGMVLGLGAAFALSRFLDSIVFGVSPRDPMVFATVALVLMGVVVTAGYVPARRATKVNPSDALRSD